MQRLIIRLGCELSDPVHWLVYSDQEQEIIASGRLANCDNLESLQEHASGARLIALAPASETFITQVELPKNASRKIIAAIPYMIEEELCGNVEDLFFALGNRRNDTQEVAVVSRQKLAMWQAKLEQANLFCERLIPDAYCLPQSDDISLLQLESDLLVRYPDDKCMQGESNWLLPLTLEMANHQNLDLTAYSEIPELAEAENIQYNFDELPLQLLLKRAENASLNLFQGEFAVKQKVNPTWDKWKVAAGLAVIALCANLIYKGSELRSIKSERNQVNQQISQTIKQHFPSATSSRDKRRAITREMARLEQDGGNVSMLAMLSQLGNAFESSGVKPQNLSFDSKRAELRMLSVAANFESLEQFRRDAQNLGFEVEQGAINNRGEEVVGLVRIRG